MKMMRYSKSTGGFYADDIDYPNLPQDLIEITDEQHAAAVAAGPDRLDVINGSLSIRPERPGPNYVWDTTTRVWGLDAALQAADDKAARDQEINAAIDLGSRQIGVLQDAVDLGIATAAEEALYKEWRTYRVLVSRLKTDAKYPAVTLPPQPVAVV